MYLFYDSFFMNKTIWSLAFLTMLTCSDSKISNNVPDFFEHKSEVVDTSKNKVFNKEISNVLSVDSLWNNDSSENMRFFNYDSLKSQQELSKALGINNFGINPEQERRQQRIKELIPQIKEPIILWDLTQPNVAITIDDGYWVESINYMLDLFEEKDVKATFFVIWDCLKLHPELWKRAAEQWHEICNHTATHSKYFKTWNEPERFEKELLWWESAVKQVLWENYLINMKKNYPYFRFPWMHWIRVKAYLDILKKHGYIPIGWRYTENPKDEIVNNGEIFL